MLVVGVQATWVYQFQNDIYHKTNNNAYNNEEYLYNIVMHTQLILRPSSEHTPSHISSGDPGEECWN